MLNFLIRSSTLLKVKVLSPNFLISFIIENLFSPFSWDWKNSHTDLVDSVCIRSNIIGVLADCIDVVLVGIVVVVVQVVVDVGHQVEHQQGEGHEIERVEAIVAFTSRATCSEFVKTNKLFLYLTTCPPVHPVWQLWRGKIGLLPPQTHRGFLCLVFD